MSKLKTRHVRVRDGKYTKRKGYSKNKKHYTRKNGKRIQKQKRFRRQTRRKVGGFSLFKSKSNTESLPNFNFSLPNETNIRILGKGWAYVTKLGSLFSKTKRPEQIVIYKKTNELGNPTGNYFVARCASSECSNGKNMEPNILEMEYIVDDPH